MHHVEIIILVEVLCGDPVECLDILLSRALRVLTAEYVFAKLVQTYRHSGPVQAPRGLNRECEILAGNKALRHAARRAIGSDPAAETSAFGEFEQQRAQHQVLRPGATPRKSLDGGRGLCGRP